MRKIMLAASVAVMAAAGSAHAAMFDYAALYGGVTLDPPLNVAGGEFDVDTGFNFGGGLGWNFDENLSGGVDIMYTQSNYSTFPGKIESMSVMGAIYYSFDIGSKWRPYIGAGVGGVQVTFDLVPPISGQDFVFGWEGMAGVTIPVANKLDLALGYKYQGANDSTISGANIEYKSHNISAGLVFSLN